MAMKITFAESSDVTDLSGAASFDASGLVCLGMAQGLPPGMRPVAALPARDGSYSLYGQVMDIGGSWSLWRARTVDGRIYSDAEQVCASGALAPSGRKWVGHATMSRRGGDGRLFFYKWSHGEGCLAMWAFASADGAAWTCCSDGVLFEDHDSNTIVWDDVTGQFIDFQTTYKRASKPFDDNIGQSRRRVMFLRRSSDGIAWTPGDWVRGAECLIPEKYLICPDDKDPAELEFYRFFPFRQDGRYVGMQLNYAASPGMLNTRYRTTKHGPHLSCEWWLSDDGFTWRRPFRHVVASGEADGLIQHEPMRLGQDLLWTDGQKVYGLLRERIFCIRSLPYAAFTTRPFQMPASPVAINAEFGFDGNPRRGMRGQGAIMVDVLGAEGQVLTGFDRDGCVIHDLDTPSQRLECDRYGGPVLAWHGRQPTELAGQTVRMRVHFRDARIYDLRWQ